LRYEIILADEAVDDWRRLRTSRIRSEVSDAIETHLRHEPTKVSKSRIKRMRGLRRPQYRLRIGEVRVFYDVVEREVQILAIIPKSEADEWIQRWGVEG